MEHLTCLVPTHRRPAFLRRFFRFYRECRPGFGFVVVDSSDGVAAEENGQVIGEACAAGLRIEHRRTTLDFVGKLAEALEEVDSRFVMMCADDDVLFPEACLRCASYLEAHPECFSVQGRTALLYPGRRWFASMRLKGYDVEDADAFLRCRRLSSSFFSNFYAVCRREELARNFRIAAEDTDSRLSYTLPEMLLSQLSALRGRIKVLPVMHLLMERHATNAGVVGRTGERRDAEVQFERFRNRLVAEFAGVGVSREAAGDYVDTAFGYFRETNLRHRARRYPVTRKLVRVARALAERIGDAFHCDRVRHRRLLRRGDIAGSEREWGIAVRLMREHPDGIPADGPAPRASSPT